MALSKVFVILALASVAIAAPAPTSTADQVVALQAEVDALRKESDLLTGSLTDNWNAFKASCGKVLTEKCAEVSKDAEAQVMEIDAKKKEWATDQLAGAGEGSGSGSGEESGSGQRLRKKDGEHGGKHGGKDGGKDGKPRMSAFVEATHCVLKANFVAQAAVPSNTNLVCDRAAKRFELYHNTHRPPTDGHHRRPHGPLAHVLFAVLLGAVLTCIGMKMFKRCRACCAKKGQSSATVTTVQPSREKVIMGDPILVTTQSAYTIKQ